MTDYELSYWQKIDGEWLYRKQLISSTLNSKEGVDVKTLNVSLPKGVLLDAVYLREVKCSL